MLKQMQMHVFLAILIAIVLVLGGFKGLNAMEQVKLEFSAKAGETATVVARRRKIRPDQDEEVNNATLVTVFDVEITAKTPTGYKILWVPREAEIDGMEEASVATKGRLMNAILGGVNLPVEFDADASGMPLEVSDPAETFGRAMTYLLEMGENNAAPAADLIGLLNSLDDRKLVQVMARDAIMLAQWQNSELPVDTNVELNEARPSPFGGGEFPSKTTVTLEKLPGTAKVSWTSVMDKADLKTGLIDYFEAKTTRDGVDFTDLKASLEKATMVAEETGHAVIGLDDGWARSVSYRKEVTTVISDVTRSKIDLIDIEVKR